MCDLGNARLLPRRHEHQKGQHQQDQAGREALLANSFRRLSSSGKREFRTRPPVPVRRAPGPPAVQCLQHETHLRTDPDHDDQDPPNPADRCLAGLQRRPRRPEHRGERGQRQAASGLQRGRLQVRAGQRRDQVHAGNPSEPILLPLLPCCDDPQDPEAERQRPVARRVLLEAPAVYVPLGVVLELEWVIAASTGSSPSPSAKLSSTCWAYRMSRWSDGKR
jgi:hypothetical protein